MPYYIVKRYMVECFEVEAENREGALTAVGEGDPSQEKIYKETVVLSKENDKE